MWSFGEFRALQPIFFLSRVAIVKLLLSKTGKINAKTGKKSVKSSMGALPKNHDKNMPNIHYLITQ